MKKIKKTIFALLNAISVGLFLWMVAIVFLQVIFRYVLKLSVPWTEELARVLLIWLVYLGIAEVEAKRDGIRTTYFIEKLPPVLFRGLLVFSDLAGICMMACLFVGSVEQLQTNAVYYLPSLPFISRTIYYVPVLIGAPLSIWMQCEQLRDHLLSPDPLAGPKEDEL